MYHFWSRGIRNLNAQAAELQVGAATGRGVLEALRDHR